MAPSWVQGTPPSVFLFSLSSRQQTLVPGVLAACSTWAAWRGRSRPTRLPPAWNKQHDAIYLLSQPSLKAVAALKLNFDLLLLWEIKTKEKDDNFFPK